jgi:hypothetical protein
MCVKRKQFWIFLRESRLLSQVMTIFIPRHLQNMLLPRSKRSYMKTYIYIYINIIVWYNNENISLFQKRIVICLALLPFSLTSHSKAKKKQKKNTKISTRTLKLYFISTRVSNYILYFILYAQADTNTHVNQKKNYILYSINSLHFSSTTHRAYLRI